MSCAGHSVSSEHKKTLRHLLISYLLLYSLHLEGFPQNFLVGLLSLSLHLCVRFNFLQCAYLLIRFHSQVLDCVLHFHLPYICVFSASFKCVFSLSSFPLVSLNCFLVSSFNFVYSCKQKCLDAAERDLRMVARAPKHSFSLIYCLRSKSF